MEQLDPKRIEEALRIANSPAGQQLIHHLQKSNDKDFKHALEQVSAGDYTGAKQILSQLSKSPELRKFLNQFGRDGNG